MRRQLLIIAVFLLIGAVTNVAVAWACAAWSPFPSGVPESGRSQTRCPYWALWRMTSFGFRWTVGIGVFHNGRNDSPIITDLEGELRREPQAAAGPSTIPRLDACSTGWPTLALTAYAVQDFESLQPPAWTNGIGLTPSPYRRALPLSPLWPGFAFNTALYATTVWLLFCGPFVLRRRRRKRRGCCLKCGYDLRGSESANCPECGTRRDVHS